MLRAYHNIKRQNISFAYFFNRIFIDYLAKVIKFYID